MEKEAIFRPGDLLLIVENGRSYRHVIKQVYPFNGDWQYVTYQGITFTQAWLQKQVHKLIGHELF